MNPEEYETNEPAEYETTVEDQIENDEINANEAAFMQGYEKDEEESFKGKSEEE